MTPSRDFTPEPVLWRTQRGEVLLVNGHSNSGRDDNASRKQIRNQHKPGPSTIISRI